MANSTTELTFTVNVGNTGAATSQDKDAALGVVTAENNRRTELNNADPPPDPLWPMLPTTPQGALLASYEEVLGTVVLINAHQSYADQYAAAAANASEAKERWRISTDAQRQASVDALEPLPT